MTDERARLLGRRASMLARMRAGADGLGGAEPARRVHVIVAIDRLLQRLLRTTPWGAWVIKGGYASYVRHPGLARTTEDVDLAIGAAIETATDMLTNAMQLDLADLFGYELAGAPRLLAGPPGGGRRYMMIARLGGQELVRFNVDISADDAIIGALEQHPSDPILEMLGYERAIYPVYPVAQQLAEKLHAYTVPREAENTRARDLADMVWLSTVHTFESDALIDAAEATFDRRATHPWPPTPTPPPTAWARQYAALRRELDLDPATPAEAHARLVDFLEPVLAGDRDRTWDPGSSSWTVSLTLNATEAHPMSTDTTLAELLARAEAWLVDDPDPATRAELAAAIEAVRGGDRAAVDDLADRFAGMLQFGTAGLRGILGAGPNRMNRTVVIRAAGGLAKYLRARTPAPTVVIGFDARHGSDVFARDTAAVVTAAGGRALLLPRPLPTPVLAFATRHLDADAGVMVTASHNPARDNGYKVYLGDGSQIVPPADVEIAARIEAVESVASVARAGAGWTVLDEGVVDAYLDAVVSVVAPETPRELSVVHTAMHGVGGEVVLRAFDRAGFPPPVVVDEQAAPDPDFPTVPFPNPEEPGAIDLALAIARRVRPDVVIASDPDADRCAVAVPDPAAATEGDPDGWRMLRGDEVGVLLGAHVIARGIDPAGPHAVLARSIVSSRLLGAMADAAGVPGVETLTGFKWIGRVPRLRYGYEEAIGYCVDPEHVADKDGISAALLVADLVAGLRAQGRTLLDVLDDLARAHGVHATDALSVRVTDLSLIGTVMARLRGDPAAEIGGVAVVRLDDLAEGAGGAAEGAGPGLPPTDGLRYLLADDTRVIVRPSGTEPKLKVYLEAIVPVAGNGAGGDASADALTVARAEAARRLARTKAAMAELTEP